MIELSQVVDHEVILAVPMHPFEHTISIVGAVVVVVVIGIAALALFFRGLSWLTNGGKKVDTLAIRGVLKKDTYATVHMTGGDAFERVRFVGFTRSEALKGNLPYELIGMVVLETDQQQRYLVRAKNIRMIVVPAKP